MSMGSIITATGILILMIFGYPVVCNLLIVSYRAVKLLISLVHALFYNEELRKSYVFFYHAMCSLRDSLKSCSGMLFFSAVTIVLGINVNEIHRVLKDGVFQWNTLPLLRSIEKAPENAPNKPESPKTKEPATGGENSRSE